MYDNHLVKTLLLDFTFHIPRNARQAVIFMCDAVSKLIVYRFVASQACQKCSEGKCKGGNDCFKTPKGKLSLRAENKLMVMRYSRWHDF